jgi:hypothetical protein
VRLEFESTVGRPKQSRRAGPEEPLEAIFGSYLVGLTLVVLLVMRADALRDRCQLVSTRNFFLLGLLLFQTVSGALTLLTLQTERGAWMGDYRFAGFAFCLILTTFLALFLAIYRSSHWVERMAWRRARIRRASRGGLVAAGVALTIIGITLRFSASGIPYVSVLLPQVSAGCLCGGAALVAMAWARSMWNIVVGSMLGCVLAGSSAVLLIDAFGRREILGLLFSVIWGLYHEKWRFLSVAWLLPRIGLATLALSAVLLVYSSARVGGGSVDRSLGQQIERMLTIDPRAVEENIVAALSGQFAGGISMLILDNRWRSGGYDPLHSLVYFLTLPIPRDLWDGKPEGLGLIIVREAGVTGVSAEHTWGPGLVGHLSHDVVLISLPIYALILAWVFRYMDARTRWSEHDPVAIALFGSALGQMMAMPRGDIGLFAFNLLAAFSGVWLFGRLVAAVFLPIDREAEWDARIAAVEREDGEEAYDECLEGETHDPSSGPPTPDAS